MSNSYEKVITNVLIAIGFIVVIAFIGLLLAFPIKWLWNYNMPYLFGLQEIDWWRAWCLHMLCSLLFKSSYSNSK